MIRIIASVDTYKTDILRASEELERVEFEHLRHPA